MNNNNTTAVAAPVVDTVAPVVDTVAQVVAPEVAPVAPVVAPEINVEAAPVINVEAAPVINVEAALAPDEVQMINVDVKISPANYEIDPDAIISTDTVANVESSEPDSPVMLKTKEPKVKKVIVLPEMLPTTANFNFDVLREAVKGLRNFARHACFTTNNASVGNFTSGKSEKLGDTYTVPMGAALGYTFVQGFVKNENLAAVELIMSADNTSLMTDVVASCETDLNASTLKKEEDAKLREAKKVEREAKKVEDDKLKAEKKLEREAKKAADIKLKAEKKLEREAKKAATTPTHTTAANPASVSDDVMAQAASIVVDAPSPIVDIAALVAE